jgi:hypothetical protein
VEKENASIAENRGETKKEDLVIQAECETESCQDAAPA